MGFNMRKSINLGNGMKMNIGKNGVSLTMDIGGVKITKKKNSTQMTTGIKGTGMYYTKNIKKEKVK